MDPWAVAFIACAVLCAVSLVAALLSRRKRPEEHFGLRSAGGSGSLFSSDPPVSLTQQRFIESMPGAVMVCRGNGSVIYTSEAARSRALVEAGRLGPRELEDMLAHVVNGGTMCQRDVKLTANTRPAAGGVAGRGVQPGDTLPSNIMYLQVRMAPIAEDLYAVFITDTSELRKFEAMRRDFVTNVSHELKTPAGAIALLAETISDAADDPKAVRYFSGRISLESQRLTELVQHLIDLQRAQNADALPNAARQSVLRIVRDAVRANAVLAESKHIDIHVSLAGRTVDRASMDDGDFTAPNDVFIMADGEAMTTAVKNLVQNAVRYSPEHTTVGVGIIEQGGKVMIRVVDQGIGIPPQSLGRIFERFYRVDPARSRQTGGSGLGLAITKHCVQDCGGTISVWSRQGEGSTFTIEIPAAPEVPGLPAIPDATERAPDPHMVDNESAVERLTQSVAAEG